MRIIIFYLPFFSIKCLFIYLLWPLNLKYTSPFLSHYNPPPALITQLSKFTDRYTPIFLGWEHEYMNICTHATKYKESGLWLIFLRKYREWTVHVKLLDKEDKYLWVSSRKFGHLSYLMHNGHQTIQARRTKFLLQLIRLRFQGYRCESGMYRFSENKARNKVYWKKNFLRRN